MTKQKRFLKRCPKRCSDPFFSRHVTIFKNMSEKALLRLSEGNWSKALESLETLKAVGNIIFVSLQKKIAIEHQNVKRAETKAAEKRKKEASLLETKNELMTPKINKL